MFLLDTNIISLLAPQRQHGAIEGEIAAWIMQLSDDLYLSVITVAEIETGISRLRRTGASTKASAFQGWLDGIVHHYAARIHALDLETAKLAGQLYDRAIAKGSNASFPDAAIAATAAMHDLTVITRNSAHFSHFEVPFIDPYDGLPAR
ncbi:PIN domain-containing protein [Pararhizobium sp.]|uniref:PIN domain-containing protein n=1 Tax=Pararhizobium sp. TaxID=1977563 RepID=UPI002723B5AE|nr:PIN domain-containing protein [Pararhizobium sp.]MDO9414653.1 PIN domain-containing protein [Pararhizobium sp.]